MEQARWYFDVISPFAYLHYHALQPLRRRIDIWPVPVLFAGLLKHWGTKGPAEVPAKRLHTYQHCVWRAARLGVPFVMPPRHPFNSLYAQRLLTAANATDEVAGSAFEFVYGQGRDPEVELEAFAGSLDIAEALSKIGAPQVKQQLLANTEEAVALGVFGVPTLVLRSRLFWGSDTVDWADAFLDDPGLFDRPEYQAAAAPEFGVARR
jgi:2-hydroxychromene-2-carboxylate isomerase